MSLGDGVVTLIEALIENIVILHNCPFALLFPIRFLEREVNEALEFLILSRKYLDS